MKDLPHIRSAAHDGHLSVDAKRIDRLRPHHNKLDHTQRRHNADKGIEPLLIAVGQKAVHKNARHDRIDDPEHVGYDRCQHDKSNCRACTREALFGEFQSALFLSGRYKILPWSDEQTDPGE